MTTSLITEAEAPAYLKSPGARGTERERLERALGWLAKGEHCRDTKARLLFGFKFFPKGYTPTVRYARRNLGNISSVARGGTL